MAQGEARAGFERYTESAQRCILGAQHAARTFGNPLIDTDHLLLGILGETRGGASQVLAGFGITPRAVEDLMSSNAPEVDPSANQLPFTPTCRAALERALREAASLGDPFIGSEHLLLGLLETEGFPLPELLRIVNLEPAAARDKTLRILAAGRNAAAESPAETASEPKEPPSEEEAGAGEGMEAVPTHQDRPATEDELGRERLAEVLGERIRRVRGEDTEAAAETRADRRRKRRRDTANARQAGSFMAHLYAPWGAGKSSLLNFLARDLRNRGQSPPTNPRLSRWIVVRFSAWEHQRLAPPWWWLLAAIQRACRSELWHIDRFRWLRFSALDVLWRLWNARAVVFTLLLVLGAILAGFLTDWLHVDVGSLSALQAVLLVVTSALALAGTLLGLARGIGSWLAMDTADGADRLLRRAHDPLGIYQRRFRWLVRSAEYPIAIFIDDLDRCKGSYVVELLEGIQTLFAEEPVTFVVAADRTWLCQSFEESYRDYTEAVGEPGRPLGFLFLEKTFQISLEIPPMTARARKDYWASLMRPAGSQVREPRVSRDVDIDESFRSARTQSEVEARLERMVGSGEADDDALSAAVRRLNAPDMQEQLERMLGVFAPLLENNPRSMKRFMNAYGIERDRLLREGRLLDRSERRELALLTILRIRWPLLADHLRSTPSDAAFCTGTEAPEAHDLSPVFRDPDLHKLFDGKHVDERLDETLLADFPRPAEAEAHRRATEAPPG